MDSGQDTVRARWSAQPGLARAFGGVAALAALLGLSLILGASTRVSGDAFTTIRAVGGPTAWGVVLLAGVVALAVGAAAGPRWLRVALLAGALMHGLLALWFFLAALPPSSASFFGASYSLIMCYWHISQALEYDTGVAAGHRE